MLDWALNMPLNLNQGEIYAFLNLSSPKTEVFVFENLQNFQNTFEEEV